MQYKDIIGQERLKQGLVDMINRGRMPHALILSGKEGVGQLPLAIATAQYMSCTDKQGMDSCGKCWSCRQFESLQHPDLHFVFPIAQNKKKNIERSDDVISEFREAYQQNPYLTQEEWLNTFGENKKGQIYTAEGDEIIRKLNIKSFVSPYKFMVIWYPELMHASCANKVLKIIEEPPENTIFFLVSTNPNAILGTIRSRAQQIMVPPIETAALKTAFTQKYQLDENQVNFLIKMAQGSWSHLLQSVSQSVKHEQHQDWFMTMMRSGYSMNLEDLRKWVDEIAATSRREQVEFLQSAQRLLRENLIFALKNPQLTYMNAPEMAFAKKFSLFVNVHNVEEISKELNLAEAQIEQNVNSKIVLTDTVLKFYRLLRLKA